MLSTPHDTRGSFDAAWRNDEPWGRYEVPATAYPRIRPDVLDEEQREMGAWWCMQECLRPFTDADTQAFRRADRDHAFRKDLDVWDL